MKMIAFICPLSKKGSKTRKRSDDIMKGIIKPVANELGYSVQRADEMTGSVIMDDIITMLHNADIVIADLTEMNPNVFYELGIRDAFKGKCINIICEDGNPSIPFDISHYRAYHYSLESDNMYVSATNFKDYIKKSILDLNKSPWKPKMPLETKDFIDIYDVTIVEQFLSGAKNHYSAAKKLFNKPCKNIFLMQRSSSLVLNAERGWGEEDEFLQIIKNAINKCGFFYHIITLEGIEAHLQRKNSVFPNFKLFSNNLENSDGNAVIKVTGEKTKKFYLKKLPIDSHDSLFKLDRQSRVLITEDIENNVKAVIVQNLGTDQTCFVIQGTQAKEYLKLCIDYYNQCELVKWNEILDLYNKYK